jgi:outer membrane protein assembly factor BamD (BamD/ComL family)
VRCGYRVRPSRLPVVCGLLAGLTLAGCQSLPAWFDPEPGGAETTLASLEPAALPPPPESRSVALEQVIVSYQEILPLLEDPERILLVRQRLADLRFRQSENRMAEHAVDTLDPAIDAYNDLLATYPDRPGNDQVLYQLAKAYGMQGRARAERESLDRLVTDHPDSEVWVESQFRRGELLFNEDRFAAAQRAFEAVIQADDSRAGKDTFVANAYFMKGWCQFKQGGYDNALLSYVSALDLLMPEQEAVQSVDASRRTLIEDLFRVMGLAFSNLDGARSVARLFERTGDKAWQILVYDRYSSLLLEKEQYTDAIAVYEQYIARHPLSRWAPRYQINIIETLRQANFLSGIPQRKAGFVDNYGITSEYWARAGEEALAYTRQQLERLIPELANRHYVLARQEDDPAVANSEYRMAARYYAEFVDTFPANDKTPEALLLLAETRLELEQWQLAIDAFRRAAYNYGAHAQAAEAGYASILAYEDYADTWSALAPAEVARLEAARQQNRLQFVDGFASDSRAVDVLYIATRYFFERQAYQKVVEQSGRIMNWQPRAPDSLLLESTLLQAHSFYGLKDYPQAEAAYQDVLLLLPEDDGRLAGITENLAASVYRQAESKLAAGDRQGAVEEFLRVGSAAPDASLRADAEYDAANTLIELEEWDRAVSIMEQFRSRHPDHEMIATLPAKMALAYRETGQWELAGDELRTLVALAQTDEEKRDTLLIAAELYDRSDSIEKAIASYRDYANTYPEPLDDYMEAANRLGELYEATGDSFKRRFWLEQQMAAVDRNRSQATDRMLYLAARAAMALSSAALARYDGIALTAPLQQTMEEKIKALKTAVELYRETASYGVADFSTEAGYRIAELYADLAGALLAAEKPSGLSELEAMQYDLLLEEQAFPFEENAIDIHEQNARQSWDGIYDRWVRASFEALSDLLPARYDKAEVTVEVISELE